MKKSALEIYGLFMCAIAGLWLVIASATGMWAVVGALKPELTLSPYKTEIHYSNDLYWNSLKRIEPRPHEMDLSRMRAASFGAALMAEKRSSAQTVAKMLINLLVSGVLFYIHWLIAAAGRREVLARSAITTVRNPTVQPTRLTPRPQVLPVMGAAVNNQPVRKPG